MQVGVPGHPNEFAGQAQKQRQPQHEQQQAPQQQQQRAQHHRQDQQQEEAEDDEYDEYEAMADAMEEVAATWSSADSARLGVAADKPDGEECRVDHAPVFSAPLRPLPSHCFPKIHDVATLPSRPAPLPTIPLLSPPLL